MISWRLFWASILCLVLCFILWHYSYPVWAVILISFVGFITGILAIGWRLPFNLMFPANILSQDMLDAITDQAVRGNSDYNETAGILGIITGVLNMFIFIKFLFMLLKW